MNANDRFEAEARLFYKRFGRLAPGKAEPISSHLSSCDRENWDQKEKWHTSGQAYEDALAPTDEAGTKHCQEQQCP